jgi:hypothetical protein
VGWKRNTKEKMDGDKCTKGIEERNKEGERLRYKINNSPLNFNGRFTLV